MEHGRANASVKGDKTELQEGRTVWAAVSRNELGGVGRQASKAVRTAWARPGYYWALWYCHGIQGEGKKSQNRTLEREEPDQKDLAAGLRTGPHSARGRPSPAKMFPKVEAWKSKLVGNAANRHLFPFKFKCLSFLHCRKWQLEHTRPDLLLTPFVC